MERTRHSLVSILLTVFARANVALALLVGLLLYPAIAALSQKKRNVFFGTTPILNNKYWAEALRESGRDAVSVVSNVYGINAVSDFDVVFSRGIRGIVQGAIAFHRLLWSCRIFATSFDGFFWFAPRVYRMSFLFKLYRVNVVIFPYGSDAWVYRRVRSPSRAHGLMSNYPRASANQRFLERRMQYWVDKCDAIIPGNIGFEGIGRWTILVPSSLCIAELVNQPQKISDKRSQERAVKVVHTPNHRTYKGTEFVVLAVERLIAEGHNIDFCLIERKHNRLVLSELHSADIVVEQLISGHGLSAVEAMASGAVVIANLEDEYRRVAFDRYSYYSECPIVSSSPERVYFDLKRLVEDEAIRTELARLGPLYVERYHSYNFFARLFSLVEESIANPEVDISNYFHPLIGAGRHGEPLRPPLVRHRLRSTGEERPCEHL